MRPLSPTQIKTFARCPRRWGFDYVEGIRGPANRFAAFGVEAHGHAEKYLKAAEIPANTHQETWLAFESGMHHWPPPQLITNVEFEIFAELDGIKYHGFQDVEFFENGLWVVGDHKFTSDFKWSLSAEDLRKDVQANIYLLAMMQRHQVDEGEARWVYYRTRGARKSLRVLDNERPVVMRRIDVEGFIKTEVGPTARSIHEWYASGVKDALQMPPNVEACDDYGGCAHRDRCGMTPVERMKALMAHQTLKEKLQGRTNAGGGLNSPETPKAPTPPAAPPPAPAAAAPATAKVASIADRMKSRTATAPPAVAPAIAAVPPAPPPPAAPIIAPPSGQSLATQTITMPPVTPPNDEAPETRATRSPKSEGVLEVFTKIAKILQALPLEEARRVLSLLSELLK